MAKIKIPLEMANGEQVRTLEGLKENFDIEKVVGYFLDGKLQVWLAERYYEDEADAVSKINKEDPSLAKKLCEIFGVTYTEEKELDTDEIARNNERVARLKQFTDDEEIIKNVECVAFNQEELAELYDRDVQKIYLCEGEFHIPKSKNQLKYELVGGAEAIGLPIEKETISENEHNNRNDNAIDKLVDIPEKIADKIGLNQYVCLKDYVVYFKKKTSILGLSCKGDFYCWNRWTEEESSFEIPEYSYFGSPQAWQRIKADGNKLFVNLDDGILIYDVDSHKREIVCTDRSGIFVVHENIIAYTDKDYNLFVYNIASKKKQKVIGYGKWHSPWNYKFNLCQGKLFYQNPSENSLCLFDIDSNEHRKLFGLDDFLVRQITPYKEELYLLLHNVHSNYVTLWNINANKTQDKPMECFKFSVENSGDLEEQIQIAPYFIYVKRESTFPVYSFNMDTKELTKVANGCGHVYRDEGGLFRKSESTYYANRFQVVGKYLYFNSGDDVYLKPNRVNLLNPEEGTKLYEEE